MRIIYHFGTNHYLDIAIMTVVSCLLIIFCVLFYMGLFCTLRYKRALVNIPYSKLGSAAQGYVKIKGKIQPFLDGEVLHSPLTQQSCGWYEYTIEEIGKNKRQDRLIARETSSSLFRIVDDTGETLIYPEEAEVSAILKGSWTSRGWAPSLLNANQELKQRLKTVISPNHAYRFSESRLNIGKEVTILGFLENHSTGRNPIREVKNETTVACKQWEQLKLLASRSNLISPFKLAGRPYIITEYELDRYIRSCREKIWLGGLFFLATGIFSIVSITKLIIMLI